MAYGSSSIVGIKSDGEGDRSSEVGSSNCCSESTDSMLDLLPDLYSELIVFLYKS